MVGESRYDAFLTSGFGADFPEPIATCWPISDMLIRCGFREDPPFAGLPSCQSLGLVSGARFGPARFFPLFKKVAKRRSVYVLRTATAYLFCHRRAFYDKVHMR